jgi:hypothetical protein
VGTELWALRSPVWRHKCCEFEWILLLKNMLYSLAKTEIFSLKFSVMYWGILYSTEDLVVTMYGGHCTDYISRTIFVPCLPMIKQVTYQLKQYCYISRRTIIFNSTSFMNIYDHSCPALHIILCSKCRLYGICTDFLSLAPPPSQIPKCWQSWAEIYSLKVPKMKKILLYEAKFIAASRTPD